MQIYVQKSLSECLINDKLLVLYWHNVKPRCNGSDGREAASYLAGPGLNPGWFQWDRVSLF